MHKFIAKYLMFLPGQWLRGENILKYIWQFEKTQWMSKEEIERKQIKQFKKLIEFAYDNSNFYKNLYNEHGLDVYNIKEKKDLLKIPCIRKDDIKKHSKEIFIKNINKKISKKSTGGSTGQSVEILKDRDAMARQDAAMWRSLRWFDIDIGSKQARFWGVPISKKSLIKSKFVDFLMNRIRLSAFNINSETLDSFYKTIINFRPEYFYGYVHLIEEFAHYCENKKYDLKKLELKGVVTTSEPISKYTKDYLENQFGCFIINDYGSGEVGPIAYSCPHGGLHLMEDNLLIEIINSNGMHAKDGEYGEVFVTELNGYSLPLIRYAMDDIAIIKNNICNCGRGLQLLESVEGRNRDFLISENGNKVSGSILGYITKDCKDNNLGLIQMQFIQKKIDYIEINLVKETTYSVNLEKHIKDKLKEYLGNNLSVKFIFADKIIKEKSGKLRLVKNEIHNIEL